MYRIGLFKNKIKASIPCVKGIRFGSSRNRSHLFISMMSYYSNEEVVAQLISDSLTEKKIDFTIERFSWGTKKPYSISIPIDQEALPERKR